MFMFFHSNFNIMRTSSSSGRCQQRPNIINYSLVSRKQIYLQAKLFVGSFGIRGTPCLGPPRLKTVLLEIFTFTMGLLTPKATASAVLATWQAIISCAL